MPKTKITHAVILAAGRGTRLWPYGDTNAKAALPVANRPLIHWQLDALAEAGIKSVSVVVGFLDGMVRSACAAWLGSHKGGQQIDFVPQPSKTGSAAAVLAALSRLKDPQAPVAILPGDLFVHKADLQNLLTRAGGDSLASLVSPIPEGYSQDYVLAETADGKLVSIHAHSRWATPSRRVLTGAHALPAGFIRHLEATPEIPTCVEIGGMPPAEPEVFEAVHQYLRAGGKSACVEAAEQVVDIDRPWDFLDANMIAAVRETSAIKKNELAKGAGIDPTARIDGHVRLGSGSRIGTGVIVYGNLVVGNNTTITDGAFIGENSIIGDDCKIWRGGLVGSRTVVGHRCVVGHGAEVEGLILDEAYSYHYGEYWGILGKCCDLGAATVCGTLRFDDGETVHRVKGRKETPRCNANATYLGDYVRTGVNAILMPGVKVGPYSLVGAGVVLNEDIPNNTSVFVEQTLRKGTWGPERYGW